jgi:hypothetical protein
MNPERRRLTTGIATISLCASLIGLAAPTLAAAPAVVEGSAVVDGNLSEWASADFFADMYRAGKATKQVESHLYLRYDCDTAILSVGVIAADGVTIVDSDGDNFVKFGMSDKRVDGSDAPADGTQPDFAYAPAGAGWEASFSLAPGSYADLNVHAQVMDGEQQTSAVEDRAIAMLIACDASSESQPQSSSTSASASASASASTEESTSATSTTFPSPANSSRPANSTAPATSESPEQDVQGATGTPAASMGNTSIGIPTGSTSPINASVAWGLLLLASAAALAIGRARAGERR